MNQMNKVAGHKGQTGSRHSQASSLAELELTLKLTEAAFRVFSSIFFDLFRAV
jgi:hypothetical protein